MSKINILANIPNRKDATSLYRAMGPLGELRRQDPRISVDLVPEYSWDMFAMSNIFFLQRPYTNAHLDMVLMAKDNGVPVWIDYDDDLFSVPVSNPAYRVYGSESVKKNVANIISHADAVTVSTPFLKKQLERGPAPLNKNITVIPNAFNSRIFNYRIQPPKDRRRLVMWRGSSTHHKDLQVHMTELVSAINRDSTWTWLFQGDKPWFLFERLGNNAVFSDSLDPILYFKHMHETKPPVMIVPLHDCEFNRAKSNIAWMEAAFFGAMTIAPAWEEWDRPGCVTYKDPKSFGEVLESVMRGEFDPTVEAEKAWDYINDNLLLRDVNKIRTRVIESLLV